MPRTTFYCYATVRRWNANEQDYDEIDLDHYSSEPTAEAAEDDAREVWMEDGYSPSRVKVRPFETAPEDRDRGE